MVSLQPLVKSPYGVPVASVAEVHLDEHAPLAPFEQQQLKNLIQQVKAAPHRVQVHFYKTLLDDYELVKSS